MNKLISLWLLTCLGLVVHAQTATLHEAVATTTVEALPTVMALPLVIQGKSFGQNDLDTLPLWLSGNPVPLDEVVVSATRWRQDGRDVPYSTRRPPPTCSA